MKLIEEIEKSHPEFIQIRKDIHAHPELGYEEVRTSELIAGFLTQWGIQVHKGIGKTGVVGVLHGSRGPGKRAIGLRADMDALAMHEHNRFAHASKNEGRMHGCGHDGHVATLLAAAKYLSTHREFEGTVNFIFQPAEEGGAGAKAMIDDGVLERFPCDEIYGFHNTPDLPAGVFAFIDGAMLASSNTYDITIKGLGGHAATPHKAIDPVVISAEVILALQTVVSRHKNPDAGAVLSVTKMKAGEAYNIIPGQVTLGGTMRTFDDAVTDQMESNIRRIVETLPQAHGGSGELNFRRIYPVTMNHHAQMVFAQSVAEETFGKQQVAYGFPRTTGSEDFSFFLQKVPGCYLWIGNGKGEHHEAVYEGMGPCELHNPDYDFNDAILPVGATYWAKLVEAFFKR